MKTLLATITSHMKFTSVKKTAGFTLIELLVVIGILGVLAAALVATIDPFEQLKKAQDANVKNTAVEFVNANIRYYTTHNSLPWVNDATCSTQAGGNPTALTLTSLSGCMNSLVADGELKGGFTTVTNVLREIIVNGAANDVVACFRPQSKAQQRDINTKFDATGAPKAGCVSTAGQSDTTCFWCAK